MKKRLLILGMILTMAMATGCGSTTEVTDNSKQQTANADDETNSSVEDKTSDEKDTDTNYKSADEITMDDLMSHDETPAEDFEYKDIPDYDGIIIKDYIGDDPIVVIPNEINGKKVTRFDKTFMNNKNVVAVRIGDNVTEVSTDAFVNCENLKYVVFGKSVQSLGGGNFVNTNIEEVVLNEGLLTIGTSEYDYVTGWNDVTISIPESVTEMHISGCNIIVKAGSYAEQYAEESEDSTLLYTVEE